MQESGVRRVVWMSVELDEVVEQARKQWGYSRSGFYRYAMTQLLQSMSVLSTKAKNAIFQEKEVTKR